MPTYRSLKRAWTGFKIAKKDGDLDKMKYYTEGYRSLKDNYISISLISRIFSMKQGTADSQTKQKEDSGTANNEL